MQAVSSVSDICDLLFALQTGSVLQPGGLYATAPLDAPVVGNATGPSHAAADPAVASDAVDNLNKVNAVCKAIREAAQDLLCTKGEYLKVVVTSYAR